MKNEFIFLGAPASGKGTQTKKLAEDLSIPHIDTGGMLRTAVADGTEFGKIAKSYMDQGKLVPAEIVVGIVRERLHKSDCNNGFILDGFPRSIEQAEALEKILGEINNNDAKTLVVNIDTSEDVLIERIINRRSCKDCGAIYNIKFLPAKVAGICDKCGGELVQRKDDTEGVAKSRLETYKMQTQPLIKFYSDKNILVNIDGNREVDQIYEDIKQNI
ncbi:MAG: adenylate kinase [Candidatus Gastranaerophilales bacterium]|nr:adenylate kinase [Candidatus Gastranaerophilales bacterium]